MKTLQKKSNNLRKKENEKICCWERLKQFIAERAEAPNEILVQQQKVPFFFINKAYHSTLTKAIKSTNKMIKMSLSFITIQTSQELRMLSWSVTQLTITDKLRNLNYDNALQWGLVIDNQRGNIRNSCEFFYEESSGYVAQAGHVRPAERT